MAKIVNTTDLTRAAKQYDPLLKTLPYNTLEPVLTELGINLLEVSEGDNIEITFERKGGLIKPYKATTSSLDASESEIGKFVEMALTPKKAYAALKDHIDNYSDKIVLNNVRKVDQQAKKHPLEALILMEKVKTVGEDIIDAMFHSARDEDDASPMGISDGWYTLMAALIVSGDIATGSGNYASSGDFDAPSSESDYTAFSRMVDWIRQADLTLRKNPCNLYLPTGVLQNVTDACANKFRYINDINLSILQEKLRDKAVAPGLNIKTHPCLGTGDGIFLSAVGNLDLGMTTKGDKEFVQVRNPYTDPNWVQFWLQFMIGQRIKSVHKKKFFMNEGTHVALELSGDYS